MRNLETELVQLCSVCFLECYLTDALSIGHRHIVLAKVGQPITNLQGYI